MTSQAEDVETDDETLKELNLDPLQISDDDKDMGFTKI